MKPPLVFTALVQSRVAVAFAILTGKINIKYFLQQYCSIKSYSIFSNYIQCTEWIAI